MTRRLWPTEANWVITQMVITKASEVWAVKWTITCKYPKWLGLLQSSPWGAFHAHDLNGIITTTIIIIPMQSNQEDLAVSILEKSSNPYYRNPIFIEVLQNPPSGPNLKQSSLTIKSYVFPKPVGMPSRMLPSLAQIRWFRYFYQDSGFMKIVCFSRLLQ